MAKNNFILYKDFKTTLDLLNNEQAGKLFKALYEYVNGRVEPNFKDGMLIVAFNMLKTQLERDLVKYQNKVKANQENGKLGGRPKKEPLEPTGLIKTNMVKNKAKKADSVSVSERDSVRGSARDKKVLTDFDIAINDFKEFRKNLKKPMTDRAVELLKNNLNKISTKEKEKIEILEQSIMNGWTSIYPLKEEIKKEAPTKENRYTKEHELQF